MLIELLLALAGPLLEKVRKDAAKRLLDITPVTTAIDRTAAAFADRDADAATHLRTWCDSPTFMSELREVMAGGHALTDDNVVGEFLDTTDLYSDDPRGLARDLLIGFFQALDEELHKSELGPVIHAREERREHDLTRQAVSESEHRIVAAVKDVAESGRAFPRPADEIAEIPEVRELVLHGKVDHARDLVNAGKTKTARMMLDKLRAEAALQSPSDELLFRIISNLGACALEEGDTATADQRFVEALELQPESAKAIANAALGAALTGRHDRSLELSQNALDRAPRDIHAMSVRLLSLQRAGHLDELDELIGGNPWIRQSEDCLGTLGQLRLEQGRWGEAEELLRDAIRMGSDNPHVHQALATAIYLSIQKTFNEDPPAHGPSKDVIAQLEEAEHEITAAVDQFSDYEDRANFHDALAGRAGLRSMLERDNEAIQDCEAVLIENPDHPVALHNKALLLLQRGGEDEAIDILEKLRDDGGDVRAAIYVAIAHFNKDDFEGAITILESFWNPAAPTKEQLDVGDVLIRAHAAAGHEEAVD